jgi:hypothetical protein
VKVDQDSVSFEELYGSFVLFRGGASLERSEVSTFASFRILLARIEAKLA